MTVSLIWAQAANGVIGRDGALPWQLPEDLARFKALTLGSTVVMGRATWESLPASVRPLPGRRNLVLSRRPDFTAPGAEVFASLNAAVAAADGVLWVIGGAAVYREAMPVAQRLVVTVLEQTFDGDVFAPQIDASWAGAGCEPDAGWAVSANGLRYRVMHYEREATAITLGS